MYKNRNGRFCPASTIARIPASVHVWQMRVTSSKAYDCALVGVTATVLRR